MIGSDLPWQADEPMVDPLDRLVEKLQRGLTGEQCPRRRQIVEPDGHGRGLSVRQDEHQGTSGRLGRPGDRYAHRSVP